MQTSVRGHLIFIDRYPIAILIEDEAIAKTEEMQFEIMWTNAIA